MTNLYAYNSHLRAQKRIKELVEDGRNLFIVHYNCESIDKPDGNSPRVASISIRNYATEESKAFSIHMVKERNFPNSSVHDLTDENLDDIERVMLTEYFQHLALLKDANWVHWKMRDETYGFAAIAHRAHVLNVKDIYEISFRHRYDLSILVESVYGEGYTANHGHLPELVKINQITDKDVVWNSQKDDPTEMDLFAKRDFRLLQNSVLRKTSIIRKILILTASGKLKTDSRLEDLFGNWILARFERVKSNPWFALIIVIFSIVGFIVTLWRIISLFL